MMNTHGQARPSAIGYLISGFPRLSETFILHEILELERQGLRLVIFPLKNGDTRNVHPEARLVKSPVIYVPVKLGQHPFAACFSSLRFWLKQQPWRFIRIAFQFFISGKKERDFNVLQSFMRWLWLCGQLQNHNITKLHAHFAHDPATMAYWCSRLLQQTYSFTAHAKDIYCYPQAWLKKKIHQARFVVTCSGYNRNYLEQLSQNGTPIHCLHHGLRFEKFKPGPRPQTEKPLVLAVGRLVEKKGFTVLLEACALLRLKGLPFACEIAGEGPQREALQERIQRLNLTGVVALRGALEQAQVISLYRAAAVLAMPSCITESGDRDGIPNVILEAMAMELPVVATKVSGIPEAVEHDKTGILVEEKNARELADAIAKVLTNQPLANQLGTAARQRVMENFDLQKNVGLVKELLLA